MLESKYQSYLIRSAIPRVLPDPFILKNDSGYLQGIPDLLILCENWWAILEVKPAESAPFEPNQEYYLKLLGEMSFSACIYPSNETEVLDALQRSFESSRAARIS